MIHHYSVITLFFVESSKNMAGKQGILFGILLLKKLQNQEQRHIQSKSSALPCHAVPMWCAEYVQNIDMKSYIT